MKKFLNGKSLNFEEILQKASDLENDNYDEDVIFHCYWSGQLNEKHLISIKSCYHFNVKDKNNRKIILWVENNIPDKYNSEIKKYAEIKPFNFKKECDNDVMNTNFYYSKLMPFYSDVVRYALLYNYGGCWFDLDVFVLRDFTPLFAKFQNEICAYEWEDQNYPNNAILISLVPKNEKLKNVIKFIINRGRGWGFQEANLTYDLPLDFTVLPCEWFDASWKENPMNISFDDFFKNTNMDINFDNFFNGAFCYHWHNRWNRNIEYKSPINQLIKLISVEKSNTDLVSVIIPTYNRFNYLLNAIQSVKNQTYKNIEIIIVNDKSTQKEYYDYDFGDCSVIHLSHNSREMFGYPCAGYVRNQGIQIAQGKYVCFLDDDDYFLPDKIDYQVKLMKETGLDFCATEGIIGNGPFKDTKEYPLYNAVYYRDYILNKIQLNEYPDIITLDILRKHNIIINSSVIMSRELIDKLDLTTNYKMEGEDYKLWIKALEITNCCYHKIPLIYYDLNHGDGQNY